MRPRRRVVITGMGVATPLGVTVGELWRRALAGDSGVRELGEEAWRHAPVTAAGALGRDAWATIEGAFPGERPPADRRALLAHWASASAFDDAGLTPGQPRCGVALASGVGEVRLEDVALAVGDDGRIDPQRLVAERHRIHPSSALNRPADAAAASVARRLGLGGPNLTVSSACASAAQAIGLAARLVRRGGADLMVAGGADSMLDPVGLVYFALLGAAAPPGGPAEALCRPFDSRRRGLVMGEGAGVVVLEAEEHARDRGAGAYAELAGYGSSLDLHQPTVPDPEGRGAARAMSAALADAGLAPCDVGYVNAHGTGTPLNDVAEARAIELALGESAARVAVSSTKSLIGHLVAACGGPELVITAASIADGAVHPTRNLRTPDPRCRLDLVVGEARRGPLRAALSNSFGFGGQNACLAVRAVAAPRRAAS